MGRTPLVEMQASSKATVIGAAAVGGIVGVYFTGELQSGLILGAALAYASTTASQFGNYAESAGETAVKVYDKTLELNAQYDLLPKIKSATDTATTAANNLDKNYGITSKIDEKLKLSQAVEKATAKVDELKSSVTGKVDALRGLRQGASEQAAAGAGERALSSMLSSEWPRALWMLAGP